MTAFRSINPSVVRFRVRNHPFEKRANRGTKERDESLILALSLHPCLLRVSSSPRKSLLRRVPRFRSSISLSLTIAIIQRIDISFLARETLFTKRDR